MHQSMAVACYPSLLGLDQLMCDVKVELLSDTVCGFFFVFLMFWCGGIIQLRLFFYFKALVLKDIHLIWLIHTTNSSYQIYMNF